MTCKRKTGPHTTHHHVQLERDRSYTLRELMHLCGDNLEAQINISEEGNYTPDLYWNLTWLHTESELEMQQRVVKEQMKRQKREENTALRKQKTIEQLKQNTCP
jgi:hypothetical protein